NNDKENKKINKSIIFLLKCLIINITPLLDYSYIIFESDCYIWYKCYQLITDITDYKGSDTFTIIISPLIIEIVPL
ncbi:MAG: hypothetical protein KH200_18290, partial [Clostridium sp.]|uniref:hypothetical protein n=1 Tax=Clostridium TaxID=1485 RepID=UPI00257CE09B